MLNESFAKTYISDLDRELSEQRSNRTKSVTIILTTCRTLQYT